MNDLRFEFFAPELAAKGEEAAKFSFRNSHGVRQGFWFNRAEIFETMANPRFAKVMSQALAEYDQWLDERDTPEPQPIPPAPALVAIHAKRNLSRLTAFPRKINWLPFPKEWAAPEK